MLTDIAQNGEHSSAGLANAGECSEVILIHSSETRGGGVVTATIFYAAALMAAGHTAEVWTPSRGLQNRAKTAGVPVYFHQGFLNAGTPLFHPTIIVRALKARRHSKAIVHSGDKHWLFGRIWLHGVAESVVFHNEKIKQRRRFWHWLATSEQQFQQLTNYATERGLDRAISLIRNGPLPDASRLDTPRSVKPIQAIGAISTFEIKKGMDNVIRAFAKAAAVKPDVRLVLGGDGPELKRCQSIAGELGISDKIDWLGWQRDTRSFYDRIDLFCLPSHNEPFGIVITEAMRAGLAVVATDTRGPRDIVLPGKTGWIVPVDDPAALAAALVDAIDDPVKTASYGEAGLARYRELYTLEAAGQLLAKILNLGQSPARSSVPLHESKATCD